MLDFFWVYQGIDVVILTTPVVNSATTAANGLTVAFVLSEACTGNVGFGLYVDGVLRAAVYTGSGINRTATPVSPIYAGQLVQYEYIPGDIVGITSPLAAIPLSFVNNIPNTLVAPLTGSYAVGPTLAVDGTLDVGPFIGIATFVAHILLFKMSETGAHVKWKEAICRVSGINKITTRLQLPTLGKVDMFLRSINTIGQMYDTPVVTNDFREIATYAGHEFHVPERAIVGEYMQAHSLSYTFAFGEPSNIVDNTLRPLLDPATGAAPYVVTSKHVKSTNVITVADEGTRIHAPDFGS